MLDFGFHFILNHEPKHPRGPRRGLQDGRHLLQALHDVQEAAQAHGLGRVHRQDHGHPRPPGRRLPAPLRERRHPLLPRGQGHRGGPHGAHRLPRDLPRLDGRRGDQPRHPHRQAHRLPRLRRPPLDAPRPRAHQARAGRRAARLGRDLPAVPPAQRQGDGAPRPLRQDRPAAPLGRRRQPGRALGGHRAGLRLHRGERSFAASAGGQGAGPEEHLRGRRGQAHSLRRAVARDAGAAHVERGRGQPRAARHVDGARDGGESRAHLRPLPAQGRGARRRRRRPDHLGSRRRPGPSSRSSISASRASRPTRAGRRAAGRG